MLISAEEFEAARPQLVSVAHRLLGSSHDAQDAVQSAWLRAASASATAGTGAGQLDSPTAWLTTVTARLCLDELRSRSRRGELPLLTDAVPVEQLTADEAVIRTENVSRALMVLLSRLTPAQRVAYVLHDLFAVPFERVAAVLGGTVSAAKQHASRARRRLGPPRPRTETPPADQAVVDAFLTAARTGDTRAMLRLLAPDCVRDADAALVPDGVAPVVTGAAAVSDETTLFLDRVRAACPLTVNGRQAHVIAPGGHALATLHFTTNAGRITEIVLREVARDDHLAAAGGALVTA